MARQTVTFVLDSERDRDVLRWLEAQGNKSAAIREAIRARLNKLDITLFDIYEAIQDLKHGTWTPGSKEHGSDVEDNGEPPDVATTLDNLGL